MTYTIVPPTILTRRGVCDGHYTAYLPDGDHIEVWPNGSAERVRFQWWETWACPAVCRDCVDCQRHTCVIPEHKPLSITKWSVCNLVQHITDIWCLKTLLMKIAPGVDFGFRPDGTLPVRASMKYSRNDLVNYPHIKDDLPPEETDTRKEADGTRDTQFDMRRDQRPSRPPCRLDA